MKRPEINKKPKVGDRVFIVECNNKARYNKNKGIPPDSFYREVTKVGNKYFYIGEGCRKIKVSIDGWKEFTSYTSDYMLYENEESYRQVQRWGSLNSKIKEYFYSYRSKPVTLVQLEDIATVLGILTEEN